MEVDLGPLHRSEAVFGSRVVGHKYIELNGDRQVTVVPDPIIIEAENVTRDVAAINCTLPLRPREAGSKVRPRSRGVATTCRLRGVGRSGAFNAKAVLRFPPEVEINGVEPRVAHERRGKFVGTCVLHRRLEHIVAIITLIFVEHDAIRIFKAERGRLEVPHVRLAVQVRRLQVRTKRLKRRERRSGIALVLGPILKTIIH